MTNFHMKFLNTQMLKVRIMFIVKQIRSAQSSEKKLTHWTHFCHFLYQVRTMKYKVNRYMNAIHLFMNSFTIQHSQIFTWLDSQMWQLLDKAAIKCTKFFWKSDLIAYHVDAYCAFWYDLLKCPLWFCLFYSHGGHLATTMWPKSF